MSFTEASVGHISVNLTVDLVGHSNKHASSGESVKLVISPFLLEGVIEGALTLSCLVDLCYELIDVMILVEVVPDGFSVVRVVTS